MKKQLFTMMAVAFTTTAIFAQNEGPTMGWSSWNTFGLNISEAIIKGQANAMVSKGLKDVGFDHINIDDGYFGGRDNTTGQLLIHPTRFPKGLKGVVDHIHEKGLKAGIYSDAGYNTCGSYHGGDKTGIGVGLYKHDQQDADFFFKELGFDFIKVDFCGGDPIHNSDQLKLDEEARYKSIATAIKNTGRTDVRMNICRWAYPGTWVYDAGFSWRTTGDIYDGWKSVKGILAENLYMSAYCTKGHYNDMDMLEVGRSMTTEEDKTHFGLWCIMNSPLLIGCNLTSIKPATLNLLKNTELIALNQDTLYQQAYVAGYANGCYLLVRDIEQWNGPRRAFAVYNPSDEKATFTVNFRDIDLAGEVKLRDVFQKKDIGTFTDSYEVGLLAHATRIFVADGETRLERQRYEAETGYCNAYSEITGNVCSYSESSFCSGGYKAGWLGGREQNDLQWRNVYSQEGGDYKLTIGFICGESRNITVSVNGKKVQTVSVNSGSWDKVGTRTLNIQLLKGWNTIRLSNATAWMPDIDYIDVIPVVPASIGQVNEDQPAAQTDGTSYNLQGMPVKTGHSRTIIIKDKKKVLH